MNRRALLKLGLATMVIPTQSIFAKEELAEFPFRLTKSEWKARLTPFEFAVMREEATERAFTSPLNSNYEKGIYHCKGCDQKLYMRSTSMTQVQDGQVSQKRLLVQSAQEKIESFL